MLDNVADDVDERKRRTRQLISKCRRTLKNEALSLIIAFLMAPLMYNLKAASMEQMVALIAAVITKGVLGFEMFYVPGLVPFEQKSKPKLSLNKKNYCIHHDRPVGVGPKRLWSQQWWPARERDRVQSYYTFWILWIIADMIPGISTVRGVVIIKKIDGMGDAFRAVEGAVQNRIRNEGSVRHAICKKAKDTVSQIGTEVSSEVISLADGQSDDDVDAGASSEDKEE